MQLNSAPAALHEPFQNFILIKLYVFGQITIFFPGREKAKNILSIKIESQKLYKIKFLEHIFSK